MKLLRKLRVSKKRCFFLNIVTLSIFGLPGAVVPRPAVFGRGHLTSPQLCFFILLATESIGTTVISAPSD